jgi:hypothetical protein
LKTRGIHSLVLWPPGPQRREANLAAARAFALSGDPSSLALPDCVVLAAGQLREEWKARLEGIWTDVAGQFSSDHAELRESGVYLPVSGPLALLSARGRELFEEEQVLPFEMALGFFLGGPGEINAEKRATLDDILAEPLHWHSSKAAVLLMEGDSSLQSGLRWKEEANSWRPARRKLGQKNAFGAETG